MTHTARTISRHQTETTGLRVENLTEEKRPQLFIPTMVRTLSSGGQRCPAFEKPSFACYSVRLQIFGTSHYGLPHSPHDPTTATRKCTSAHIPELISERLELETCAFNSLSEQSQRIILTSKNMWFARMSNLDQMHNGRWGKAN